MAWRRYHVKDSEGVDKYAIDTAKRGISGDFDTLVVFLNKKK